MTEVRQHKLESVIQHEVSQMIMSEIIKDPRVGNHLGIKQVELSKDGSLAKLWISTYLDPENLTQGVEGLNHASGFLTHQLAKKLDLKILPKLFFIPDESIKKGMELNRKIDELLSS